MDESACLAVLEGPHCAGSEVGCCEALDAIAGLEGAADQLGELGQSQRLQRTIGARRGVKEVDGHPYYSREAGRIRPPEGYSSWVVSCCGLAVPSVRWRLTQV